jgi:DNA-binding transcriptional MerR regulator
MNKLYTVRELAEAVGVTPRTIRFYEAKGLLVPERVGQTRVHTYRELARMKIILRGKRLGFTLAEIKDYLDLYELDQTHESQLELLLERVWTRRAALKKQRGDIEEILDELADIERQALQLLDRRKKEKAGR